MIRLLLLFLAALTVAVKAHRPLPLGVTCSSQFFSPETALTIPNPKISWASPRIFTCDEPIFWLEGQADENQPLSFTVTVPVIDRFQDVRISVAVVGPSLPAPTDDMLLPDDVRTYAEENGFGVALFESPQDQSTCDHLTAEPMIEATNIVEDRCHFYEPFGGSNSWVVLDRVLTAPATGLYKFAVFVEGETTGKATFACCDWPEDFLTEYEMPEPDCPFCGTKPSENPAYSSLYYEHESMAEYGGFPPAVSCSEPDSENLQPTEDQCPPIVESGTDDSQPASCALGCSNDGECHSHNVFGECTHQLDWSLEPKFGNAPVSKVTIFKGDKINFQYDPDGSAHNLFEMTDESSFDECNFDNATALADTEAVRIGHTITFDEAGMYYYSCGISCTGWPEEATERQGEDEFEYDPTLCHCTIGQKIAVEVKDSSEGLRCHDHAPMSNNQETLSPLVCPDEEVVVNTINNPDYGANDETECAEFCTPSVALQFMQGVELGTCASNGFTSNPTTKTVTPPGSPQDIEVRVTSSEEASTCHCHSYEKIVCPYDDARHDDSLYAEHIEEIEEFCTGILDGSEESCPYKCFQPMEVLHLHYLECESREVDSTYVAVNATGKCHIAATAPEDADCPVVTLGGTETGSSSGAASMHVGQFLIMSMVGSAALFA